MKRPVVLLVCFAVLGVVALLGAAQLRLEFDIHHILNASAGEVAEVREMHERLPWPRPNVLLALRLPRVLTRADVVEADRVARALEEDGTASSAISLARVPVVVPGKLLPQPFLSTVPSGEGAGAALSAAWSHPLLRGTLVSEDGRTIVVPLMTQRRAERLRARAQELAGSFAEVRVLGSSVVLGGLRQKLESGLVVVLGLEVLCFLVLLPLLFRTVRGSVLPLAVVLVAVLFNFAWMGYLGYGLTVLDVAIPGLVVIIGLCDTIHLIQRFEEHYALSGNGREAVRAMIASVGRACFYTSFTTAVGFLSLIVTEHDAVSAFGAKAAVSVFVTFVVVMLLLPALLQTLPLGPPRSANKVELAWLGYGRPRLAFAVLLLGLAGVAFGITQVKVDSFLLEEIPPGDRIARDLRWYEDNVSGILDVEARVVGSLRDAQNFAALEQFQEVILREDGLTRVESITLFVREALGNPSGALDEAQIARGFGLLRAARDFVPTHLADDKAELARVVFKSRDVGVARMDEIRGLIEALAKRLPGDLQIECAGYVLMANRSTSLVVRSMLESLALSMLVIAVFLAFLLRSIRLALVALLSNLLPLAVALALSGLLGIPVTIGSAVIYCLGLGLAVDDSIHILSRYEHEKRVNPGLSKRALLQKTLRSSGTALILTSAVLVVGTLCHLAAEFQTLQNVGILLTSVVVSALLVDLWILPLLVERFDVRVGGSAGSRLAALEDGRA